MLSRGTKQTVIREPARGGGNEKGASEVSLGWDCRRGPAAG